MVTHAAFCCFVGLTWLRRSSLQVFSGLTGQQTLSPLYTHHTDSQNNGETSNVKWVGLIHYSAFFGSEGHVALDRNPGPGYDTLLLRMVPGDLLSAFPHRQFRTLPGLLDSRAALPNSNPNACMPMQGGSLYHFYFGLWYDPAERRTHDLPCERRTRYRLSQPDTVKWVGVWMDGWMSYSLLHL